MVLAGTATILMLMTAVTVVAVHGTVPTPRSSAGRAVTTPGAPPTSTITATTTVAVNPSAGNPTAAWWAKSALPDTNRLRADIETMSSQTGDPNALAASCSAFAADAATADSAAPAPAPNIEQERRQTLATVTRIVDACASAHPSRVAEDLQPASLTIHDLDAQVTSSLR